MSVYEQGPLSAVEHDIIVWTDILSRIGQVFAKKPAFLVLQHQQLAKLLTPQSNCCVVHAMFKPGRQDGTKCSELLLSKQAMFDNGHRWRCCGDMQWARGNLRPALSSVDDFYSVIYLLLT